MIHRMSMGDNVETQRAVVRWTILVFVAINAMVLSRHVIGDWSFFVRVGHAMWDGDGLAVYATRPNVQSGPVSLVAISVLNSLGFSSWTALSFLFGALGLAVCSRLHRLARLNGSIDSTGHGEWMFIIGATVMLFWWTYFRISGHLDDALVVSGAVVAVDLVQRNRRLGAAALIGLTLAIKPWAVFLLPLTIRSGGSWPRRLLPPLVSLLVGAAIWGPFILADLKTLDGIKPIVGLAPDSALRMLGIGADDVGSSVRVLQLVGALVVVGWFALRGRYAAGILSGFAVRLVFDPATWEYYSAGMVTAALLFDVVESKRKLPVATLLTTMFLAPVWVVPSADARASLRFAGCIMTILVVWWTTRARSADELDAQPGLVPAGLGRKAIDCPA